MNVSTPVALISMLLLWGCSSPPDLSPAPGRGDPYPAPMNDPQITVLSPELREWLGFHPAMITRLDGGPMQVEVPVRNLSERNYQIDFRMIFYDAAGMEVEPVMGWEHAVLGPKQVVRLKRGALDSRAETYKLEVKWAR